MTFKTPHAIILSSIYLFASSCQSYIPFQNTTSITKTTNEPCIFKSTEVKIFRAGEEIKFKYDEIGVVEFHANYEAEPEAKIDYLKNKAWENCADAIINISSDYNYGIAVKMIKDKAFFENYTVVPDTSFTSYVKMDQNYLDQSNRETNFEKEPNTGGIQALLFFTGILILPFIISGQSDDDN